MKAKYFILVSFLLNSVFAVFTTSGKLMAQVDSAPASKKLIEINSFVIFVNNPEASKDFYQNIFGLKVKEKLPNYIQLEGGITLWDKKRANNIIFKNSKNSNDSPAVKKFEFYFETEDIEAVLQKLETVSVTYIHGLEIQPWGQRVVRFYDPDENIIEIGEKMAVVVKQLKKQNFTDEEIAKKTFLPIEVIRDILKK